MDVICHRACPAGGPENSLEAARAVPEWIDMIEIDVRRCQSGELVVFHDRLLDRMTDERGAVAGTDWGRLRGLGLDGTASRVPLLRSFLDTVPSSIGLNLELKHAGLAEALRRLLEGVENEILVSSFVPQAIVPFDETPFDTALLIDPHAETDWAAELAGARSIGAEAVHPQYDMIDAQRVSMAHEQGFSVNAWTVPDADAVNRLESIGVDGVIVDDWRIVTDS